MDSIITAATDNWFWTIMCIIFVFWVVLGTIESMVKSISHERSRREIAAYIAEGSMTPEQGERLLASKPSKSGCP